MKGKRVKLVRSNIATNLGTIGTVDLVRFDGTLDVTWDQEIFITKCDDGGKEYHVLNQLSWVQAERVEVLNG